MTSFNKDGINGREGKETLYYVGVKSYAPVARREVFYCFKEPTSESHGQTFDYAIGPFKTKAAADFMATDGFAHPSCLTPNDAERFVATGSFAIDHDSEEQEDAA